MRKKGRIFFSLCILLFLSFLTGCEKRVREPVVAEKEIHIYTKDGILLPESASSNDSVQDELDDREYSVVTQVHAPEMYQAEFSNDNTLVYANAEVVVPEVEGIKVKDVEAAAVTEELMNQFEQVLFQGNSLHVKVYDKQENYYGGTVKRGEDTYNYSWQGQMKDSSFTTVKFERVHKQYTSFYETMFEYDSIMQNSQISLTAEEAMAEGQLILDALGFQAMTCNGWEYVIADTIISDNVPINSEMLENSPVYGIALHYTKTIDDIPVSYTREDGNMIDLLTIDSEVAFSDTSNEEHKTWTYENLRIVFSDNGLEEFTYTNPEEVLENSREDVFLLPFSEISQIFESMVLDQFSEYSDWGSQQNTVNVEEVRLGYMRVRRKGDDMKGKLIPVWDFYGNITTEFATEIADGDTFHWIQNMDSPYESLMTINAMDGTVINRGYGY